MRLNKKKLWTTLGLLTLIALLLIGIALTGHKASGGGESIKEMMGETRCCMRITACT